MRFVSRKPRSPALRGVVECFWWFESAAMPHRLERLLPSGKPQLLVNLADDQLRTYASASAEASHHGGSCLSGVHGEAVIIDTAAQRAVVGASLSPVGAAALLGGCAEAVADTHADLAVLWGRAGLVVRERLLEASSPECGLAVFERVLCERVGQGDPDERRRVSASVDGLHLGLRTLCAKLGTTERSFRRHFRRHVGITPKRYARVRRLGRVLRAVDAGTHTERGRVDWARLALDSGYCDQAHLARDFRELAMMRPSAYRPRAPGDVHHVAIP